MRWRLNWLVSLTACCGLAAAFSAAAQQQRFFTIGTGGVTGVYYSVGGAICQLVNKQRRAHGLRCSVEATQASVHNLQSLYKLDIDLALAQSDTVAAAVQGQEPFRTTGPDGKLRTVMALHRELVTVVARKNAGVHTFEDLRGKRVNFGPPGAGTRFSMDKVLQALDMKDSDFAEILALKPDEQGEALCAGRIDAFIYIVGHPARNLTEVATACPVTFVPLAGIKMSRLSRTNPHYEQGSIPARLYPGQTEAVDTLGFRALLMASSETSDKVVYEIVRAVSSHFAEFVALHPALAELDPGALNRPGFDAPLHPGAARYFREKR